MNWISVKEKLPKDKEVVIIGSVKQKETIMARYYEYCQKFFFEDKDMKPTHWMPRPKPPSPQQRYGAMVPCSKCGRN